MSNKKDKEILEWIAKRFKELRKERGLSQEEVLNDTDFNISRLEMGKTNVSIRTLNKLCKYFGVSLSEFFKDF